MITERPVDIFSATFKANPFPYFAHLRATMPVYRTVLSDKQEAWLITRYDDVAAILKDERFAKNKRNAMTPVQLKKVRGVPAMFQALDQNMLDLDAPDHTRLRGLVHKVFTPRLIEQMTERVQTLSDQILDGVQSQGRMNLIADYALPIPLTIISEMLGIPESHRGKFHKWINGMITAQGDIGMIRIMPGVLLMLRYLRGLVAERRAEPHDDLISALVAVEAGSDQLSADEVLAMIFLLIVAGHETTVNLIGNGMLALLQNPDQMAKLRGDPTLIKPAVEELLRFCAPLETATERYAREDVTISGVTIPRGERVFAVLASANHDETYFPNPETLDITRENNKHLAFGQGVHYCMGAPLARLEGQIAINTLLRRLPDLRLAVSPESLHWRQGIALRGLEALPVTF